MENCGIYVITHLPSGRCYVGSSVHIRRRWSMHRSQLRRGVHHSPHLQRAWDKHGEAAFAFEVIEPVAAPKLLVERENYHLAKCKLAAGVYNVAPICGSTLGLKLGPMPEDQRRKIGEAQRGKVISEFLKRRASEVHKGKTLSASHRAALIESVRTRVHSDETRRKLSERATNISDETRRRRSESVRAAMTPELRAVLSERSTNISDETRRRRSDSVRRSWIARKAALRS